VSAFRLVAKAAFSAVDLVLAPYPGPRILIYHQVGAGHGREMDVSPKALVRHLDWLETHGEVVSLEQAIENMSAATRQPNFVLSFDDGYRDMYERAFPLLRRRRLPFTLYLTTEPVETGRPLNPDRDSAPLTWTHVEEMDASGLMTLGNHTHTHRDLRRASPGDIAADLETADRLMESRLGRRPRHFAYPWGYWSTAADREVRGRYLTATLGGGSANGPETDLHRLHRIPIQLSDGVVFFRRKMRRGQRSEEFVRRMLTGYRGP
jgi:peptidoglycan/xylan/chitin deacetylase (PgdA/CDA1 family)